MFASWREMRERSNRYGLEINSYDWLKFAALVIMTIDHVGAYLIMDGPEWWKAVGRVTFPVWFFLAGYSQSRKLGGEIIWLGLLLQVICAATYHGVFPLNALFSIIICRYIIFFCKDRGWIEKYPFEIFTACLILSPFTTPFFEYGTLGVAFAAMGDMVRRGYTGRKYQAFFVLSTFLYLGWQHMWFNFDMWQSLVVWAGTGYTVWILASFEVRETHLLKPESTMASTVRFISRNTMHYYFYHRAAFQIAAVLLGIKTFEHFILFN